MTLSVERHIIYLRVVQNMGVDHQGPVSSELTRTELKLMRNLLSGNVSILSYASSVGSRHAIASQILSE